MHRARGVAVILIVILAAACSNDAVSKDEAGPCPVKPGADCRDEDLRYASFVDAQLAGIDLSGSDLSLADMRGADLTGAKFVGATLGGTDFTGATLRGADLTRAFLFGTIFVDADLSGANQTGATRCNVVEPNGAITVGFVTGADGVATPCRENVGTPVVGAEPAEPTTVEYFRIAKPGKCLNDTSGMGIDVEWSAPSVNSLNFLVDGVRIETDTKPRGTKRLPFECDRKQHIVTLQVFGPSGPSVSSSFALSLRPVAPLTAGG